MFKALSCASLLATVLMSANSQAACEGAAAVQKMLQLPSNFSISCVDSAPVGPKKLQYAFYGRQRADSNPTTSSIPYFVMVEVSQKGQPQRWMVTHSALVSANLIESKDCGKYTKAVRVLPGVRKVAALLANNTLSIINYENPRQVRIESSYKVRADLASSCEFGGPSVEAARDVFRVNPKTRTVQTVVHDFSNPPRETCQPAIPDEKEMACWRVENRCFGAAVGPFPAPSEEECFAYKKTCDTGLRCQPVIEKQTVRLRY